MDPESPPETLEFRGGALGAVAPLLVFVAGVSTLALQGAPSEKGFWPVLVASIFVAMLLARDRTAWAQAVVAGMSRPVVLLMVLAWLLAGALGAVLGASGLIDGLVWAARAVGLQGGGYAAAAFLVCCAVSTSTGTSLGTVILATPLLYPAAAGLGVDPVILMGAILGGAVFGDNVSPVSDTTIASAFSQGAEMGEVVRSRMKYAVPAALVATLVAFALGSAPEGTAAAGAQGAPSAAGLVTLVSPVLVIVLLLRGQHLLVGLLAGLATAVAVGLAAGRLHPSDVMSIDPETFSAQGLLVEGIDRGIGVSVFTFFLMGIVAGLERSGLVDRAIAAAERRTASAREAERWSVATLSVVIALIMHPTVGILTVGSFTRRMGERFGVGAARRANLLDLAACSWPNLVPWFIPAILTASMTGSAEELGMPRLSPLQVGMANVHSWALLGMALVAVVFGFGRDRNDEG